MKKFFGQKPIKILSGVASLLFAIGENKKNNGWLRIVSTGTNKSKKRFSQDVARLISEKYIQVVKNEKKELLAKLSEDGFIEYLKLKLITTESLPKDIVCVVVFDIPEKNKKIRENLRHFLDRNYFLPLQKSVWISQFDVSEILAELLVYFEIQDWVRVFVSKEVSFSKIKRSPKL